MLPCDMPRSLVFHLAALLLPLLFAKQSLQLLPYGAVHAAGRCTVNTLRTQTLRSAAAAAPAGGHPAACLLP
jgi:hypothetical protein